MTGPSGSGKTSLLRAMAGLWNTGRGKITFYVEDGENLRPSISSDSGLIEADTTNDSDGKRERSLTRNYKSVFFLPQRPYMVLGTLRQQLLYPTWSEDAIPSSNGTDNSFPPTLNFTTCICEHFLQYFIAKAFLTVLERICFALYFMKPYDTFPLEM